MAHLLTLPFEDFEGENDPQIPSFSANCGILLKPYEAASPETVTTTVTTARVATEAPAKDPLVTAYML